MLFHNLDSSLKLELKNTARDTIIEQSDYKELMSPFSRIFYVEEGTGFIYFENKKTILEPGYLYLIPSYVFCTYSFNPGLELYYIHFVNSLDSGYNLYDLFYCSVKILAREIDKALFSELLKIHPDMALRHTDPKIYQKKTWIHKDPEYKLFSQYIETSSIIAQLLSRFICSNKTISKESINQRDQLKPILAYIFENLDKEIKITDLADMASMSRDHFTRVFKNICEYTPNEYINKKRIEKAQTLLVTTGLSQKEIMEKCGFNSISYFSRMFMRYTKKTPGNFRESLG